MGLSGPAPASWAQSGASEPDKPAAWAAEGEVEPTSAAPWAAEGEPDPGLKLVGATKITVSAGATATVFSEAHNGESGAFGFVGTQSSAVGGQTRLVQGDSFQGPQASEVGPTPTAAVALSVTPGGVGIDYQLKIENADTSSQPFYAALYLDS